MIIIPCKNCITLPICRSEVDYNMYPNLVPLIVKCSLLKDFLDNTPSSSNPFIYTADFFRQLHRKDKK